MAEIMRFLCPGCGKRLKAPETAGGRTVKCPTCSTAVVIPETPDGAAQTTAAPRVAPPPLASDSYADDPAPRQQAGDDDMDYDDRPSRRSGGERPGKVQAIAIMTLIGGILAIFGSLVWLAYIGLVGVATIGVGLLCCLWPGPYYGLVMGIMATIKGSQLLGKDAHRLRPPKGIAIMQILNIVNLDLPNCVMGILTLVFLNEPEVRRYFRG